MGARKYTSQTLKEFFGKPLTMEEENKILIKMLNESADRYDKLTKENEELFNGLKRVINCNDFSTAQEYALEAMENYKKIK